MNALYQAVVTSEGGRDGGHVRSDDGLIDFDVRLPPGLGGKGGATNPEQLFAAGYAACFASALQHLAATTKTQLLQTKVVAKVSIGKKDARSGFMLEAELQVSAAGVDRATLQKMADVAHQSVCPYSHATRGNMAVKVSLLEDGADA